VISINAQTTPYLSIGCNVNKSFDRAEEMAQLLGKRQGSAPQTRLAWPWCGMESLEVIGFLGFFRDRFG
jgi:hypothetical protein